MMAVPGTSGHFGCPEDLKPFWLSSRSHEQQVVRLAQDAPGLGDFSCRDCMQVDEQAFIRFHRLNQQERYYFQSVPLNIMALTSPVFITRKPPD